MSTNKRHFDAPKRNHKSRRRRRNPEATGRSQYAHRSPRRRNDDLNSVTEPDLDNQQTASIDSKKYLIVQGGDLSDDDNNHIDPYYSALNSEGEAVKDKYDTVMVQEGSLTDQELQNFFDTAPDRNQPYQRLRNWVVDSYHYRSIAVACSYSYFRTVLFLAIFVAGLYVLSRSIWNFVTIAYDGFHTTIYDCVQAQDLCNRCQCACIWECGATRLQIVMSSLVRAYYLTTGDHPARESCPCGGSS